jgi:cobalt-zinc-cadmium efflux system protein
MPHPHHGTGGHDHGHGPTRSAETLGVSDARLLVAVLLNHLLTLVEAAAGVASGSVALLSDAAHNFNDANTLLIAYIARRVSRKDADERYTFGYRRAELIGALINLTLLGVIGLYLIYEAVARFITPEPITGWLMAAAAGLALIVDVATALLLWAMSRGSINVRTAFVHNLVDALGSAAVLIGAGAIIWLDWRWVDPALTLLIAGYVLYLVAVMLPRTMRVLMEGVPPGLDVDEVVRAMESVELVENVHHVHAWELDEQHRALEAHVVIAAVDATRLEPIKTELKRLLKERFGIGHATLEFELGRPEGRSHSTQTVPAH